MSYTDDEDNEEKKTNPDISKDLTEFGNEFMRLLNKHGDTLSALVQRDSSSDDPAGLSLMLMQTATVAIFWRMMQDIGYGVTEAELKQRFVDCWIELSLQETSSDSVAKFTPLS